MQFCKQLVLFYRMRQITLQLLFCCFCVIADIKILACKPLPFSDSLPAPATAQSDSFLIRNIFVDCNKRTLDRIILRELAYQPGDKIAKENIQVTLQKEASKIFNTNLFVLAEVFYFPVAGDTIDLIVAVMEKWYLYPIPYVELADRNFNEWWQQRGRDLDRLIYGIRLSQQNVRGRNEYLKLTFQLGFTRKFEIEYNIPYIDKKQTTGLNFSFLYDNNKNLAYKTAENRLLFLRSEEVLRSRFMADLAIFKRSQFYNTHFFELRYHHYRIADTIARLNPEYFANNTTQQKYFEVAYVFNRDLRDMANYPLKGRYLQITALQKGLSAADDLNLFDFRIVYAQFLQLSQSWYFSTSWRGQLILPLRVPFAEMRGFGYSSTFVRGYDLYVVDGPRYGVWKNTLRWRLFANDHFLRNVIPMEQFKSIPVAIYLKTYADAGYVDNPFVSMENKRLTNRWLIGVGTGLDLVLYNSAVLRFEYSLNREGDKGFFFNLMTDF
ncbi:MAG: BamA/TamA family outer membrane protein [Cytophagales bacterium]|nr:BamA/TamA family outer membrane protein [Bernardetiaceae bacterium]MDW8203880.1 BamA/TamA family outer membrane protein [Cytophagales bacterium]